MNAHATIEAFDLGAWMRSEGVIDIHRDRLLDRFSVTLTDYSLGIGFSVEDALADAHRRAA